MAPGPGGGPPAGAGPPAGPWWVGLFKGLSASAIGPALRGLMRMLARWKWGAVMAWYQFKVNVLRPFIAGPLFLPALMVAGFIFAIAYTAGRDLYDEWQKNRAAARRISELAHGERRTTNVFRSVPAAAPSPTPTPSPTPAASDASPEPRESTTLPDLPAPSPPPAQPARVPGGGPVFTPAAGSAAREPAVATTARRRASILRDPSIVRSRIQSGAEAAEWVNAAARAIWQRYNRDLSSYFASLLQPLFDSLDKPSFVESVSVTEFSIGDAAPWFSNVQIRRTRSDDDLQYQFGMRYTGSARLLINVRLSRAFARVNVPIVVSDLDIDAAWWMQLRLMAEMPWVSAILLAFTEMPKISVSISPFNVINLMSVPGLSKWVKQIFTSDLPALFVLPEKITIPMTENPAHMEETSPNPRVPEAFRGVLKVVLREAINLPAGGMLGANDPFCVLELDSQRAVSKVSSKTSSLVPLADPKGTHPLWNQYFEFLIRDPDTQHLDFELLSSSYGRPQLGTARLAVGKVPEGDTEDRWIRLEGSPGGLVHVRLTYEPFVTTDVPIPSAVADNDDDEPPTEVAGRRRGTTPRRRSGRRMTVRTADGTQMDVVDGAFVSADDARRPRTRPRPPRPGEEGVLAGLDGETGRAMAGIAAATGVLLTLVALLSHYLDASQNLF